MHSKLGLLLWVWRGPQAACTHGNINRLGLALSALQTRHGSASLDSHMSTRANPTAPTTHIGVVTRRDGRWVAVSVVVGASTCVSRRRGRLPFLTGANSSRASTTTGRRRRNMRRNTNWFKKHHSYSTDALFKAHTSVYRASHTTQQATQHSRQTAAPALHAAPSVILQRSPASHFLLPLSTTTAACLCSCGCKGSR